MDLNDPLDCGLPFELIDVWKPSTCADSASQHDSIFESLDTTLPILEGNRTDSEFRYELDPIIPELELHDHTLKPEVEAFDHSEIIPPALDPWDLEGLLSQEDQPRLCTWDGFEKQHVPGSERTGLISEAGPAAFDAALNVLPELRNDVGVFPQDYALRGICNLALGRSSTLFQWNAKTMCFERTVKGASITGISRSCCDSFGEDITDLGSTIAKLRAVTEVRRLAKLSSATLALYSCITSILNAVDESISGQLGGVRSILQLQDLVAVPQRLIRVSSSLVESVKDCRSDEAVISAISDRIHEEAQIQHELCPVLRAVLARISVPWLERLSTDIGFCSTQAAFASGYATGEDEAKGLEQTMTFVTTEDAVLIQETRKAIRLLRRQDEYHPLLQGNDQAFEALVNPALDRQKVVGISDGYERDAITRLNTGSKIANADRLESANVSDLEANVRGRDISQETTFEQTSSLMSCAIKLDDCRPADLLHAEVLSICSAQRDVATSDNLDLVADVSTTPLERVRPLIRTQQRLANGVLLRRLLRYHRLEDHLGLQKSFQLFGNGDFVLRLSTALFSQDTQSAERRRGTTLTGESMGLRLGTTHEERWPPASSELQLTLMGILNETYGKAQARRAAKSVHERALPGALSFAIRQLPEAEIDKVLDPNSLYALDFLRLQYTIGTPLDAILTGDALDKYDGMFRYLLRLLRVVHVTANLRKVLPMEARDAKALAFVQQANHLASVLMSHTMELGINNPWQTLTRSIKTLEGALAEEDAVNEIGTKAVIGVEGLRNAHDRCLESVRSRLFLKRKQEKLRKSVEEALDAILKASFALQRNDPEVRGIFEQHHKAFEMSSKDICSVLRELVDKSLRRIQNEAETEDIEVHKILLARLEWNAVVVR